MRASDTMPGAPLLGPAHRAPEATRPRREKRVRFAHCVVKMEPTKSTGGEPRYKLKIPSFCLGTRGEEKFNIPADFNFLEVTAVGKDVRRLPYGPDRDMQRISELFGSNSGAACHWIDFPKNLGSYKARARTELFVASQLFNRSHLLPH